MKRIIKATFGKMSRLELFFWSRFFFVFGIALAFYFLFRCGFFISHIENVPLRVAVGLALFVLAILSAVFPFVFDRKVVRPRFICPVCGRYMLENSLGKRAAAFGAGGRMLYYLSMFRRIRNLECENCGTKIDNQK